MAVGEAQAFLGELIQAGSGDLGLLVVAAEIAKTEIVAVENQDIGECCLGGEKREAGRENEQGKGSSSVRLLSGQPCPWEGVSIRSRRTHEQDDSLYLGSNHRRGLGPERNCGGADRPLVEVDGQEQGWEARQG
jgi:hypothetical protein